MHAHSSSRGSAPQVSAVSESGAAVTVESVLVMGGLVEAQVRVAGSRAVYGPTHENTLKGARFLRNVLKKLGDDEGAAALAAELPGL